MRLIYVPISLAFLALSVYVMIGAFDLDYYTPIGPGPGFFPFWLAAILAVLTVAWLAQVCLRICEPLPQGFFPDRSGVLRILSILGALIIFVVLGDYLGFRITMLGFLLFLIFSLGRHSMILVIAVAFAGSFGSYYIFHDLMGVHLPLATIGFLEKLGL